MFTPLIQTDAPAGVLETASPPVGGTAIVVRGVAVRMKTGGDVVAVVVGTL